ncbi:hypothetical protein TMatcc_005339 [Talaromyces marneffei ATCC 18224]
MPLVLRLISHDRILTRSAILPSAKASQVCRSTTKRDLRKHLENGTYIDVTTNSECHEWRIWSLEQPFHSLSKALDE